MKVLVTGAAGFLAPHVAHVFRLDGHDVRLTDVRSGDGAHRIVTGDFTDPLTAASITQGIDVICHLGGVGDVYLALEQPFLAASANVVGTAALLEAARCNGVTKFIYASTWEVYGEPRYQPVDEEHPCNPDHPYGITKLAGEKLALACDALKGLPVVSLRLGTAYGTGMRGNSVFSVFIERAMQGEPITVAGSGEQTRQFTHASDIGRAFLLAATAPVHGEAINIVAGERVSIRQLAELVAAKYPTSINHVPARQGDVPSATVSSEKAGRLLAWKPDVGFREGLGELMASRGT